MDTHAPQCWQYLIRQENMADDLEQAGLTHAKMATLRVCDFKFCYVPREDKQMCHKIRDFIIRYEWLGKMSHRPTHRFVAIYNGHLAAAIIMSVPNAFSKKFVVDGQNREKLISRGACISWSPKNLASSLLMYSIRWMAQNTRFRFFTAYSDTTAGEIGTIYQACNFIYLGQKSGDRYQYFDALNPGRGWFGERSFRNATQIKGYAKECGIEWEKSWNFRDRIYWDKMPSHVACIIKARLKRKITECERKKIPLKHKYVYILGKDKRETKKIRKSFSTLNPGILNSQYPSRG